MSSCNICFEDHVSLIEVLHTDNSCGTHKCCQSCAYIYLNQKIKEKQVSSELLTCPVGCKQPLTHSDVHRIMNNIKNPQLFGIKVPSFQQQRTELLLRFDEAMKAQSIIESERDRRLNRHMPSLKDIGSDIALGCWSAGKDTRRCPGCRHLIEKNGGCQHMTCSNCRHQFWWCCGRSTFKSHNEALCFPLVFLNSRNRYWGPNILVRTVTKTTVAGVGIGVGCAAAGVAVVAIPTYLMGKLIDEKGGFADRRRQAELDRRTAARERREKARAIMRQQRIQNGEDPDPFDHSRNFGFHRNQNSDRHRHILRRHINMKYRLQFNRLMNELLLEAPAAVFDRELNRLLSQPVVS